MTARSPLLPVLLAVTLLLAGCSAVPIGSSNAPAQGATTTQTPVSSGGDTPSASGGTANSSSARRSSTATPTAVPKQMSPWGDHRIVVAIDDQGEPSRNFTSEVQQATQFWQTHDRRYLGYQVHYVVKPNASNPDIVVTMESTIPKCGNTTDAAGCAPLIQNRRQIHPPEHVYVESGLSENSTVLVMEHEFGHTLGLDHQSAPHRIMKPSSVLYTEAKKDAVDRAFPWPDPNFKVYVDYSNASNPSGARDQIDHAFKYYADGADGSANVPQNLTFTNVASAENADIVIRFSDTSPCGDGAGSCFTTVGPDPDGDGSIEQYHQLRITIVDLQTDAIAWHVGNWFAYGLGMENPENRPQPFRNAGYDERRSKWWR